MRRPGFIVLAVTAGALLVPSASQAATLSFSGDTLTYTAGAGEENNLSTALPAPGFCAVRADPCLEVKEGSGVSIAPIPADCTYVEEPSSVECRVPAAMVVNLGDRDDTLFDWNGPSTVDGGPGGDGLDGGAGNDILRGGIGNDTLYGEIGDDRLEGGEGDDAMEGFGVPSGDTGNDTSGRDVYLGGGGTDLVDYTARTEALSLDPDGAADDGAPGEGDTIGVDVERLYSGSGNDTLGGSPAPNWLYGHAGDDRIAGATGNDVIKGGFGADEVAGEDGDDELMGDDGADRLDGGRGVDVFDGDGGFRGADTILARDGAAETINCGAGADSAVVDATDTTLFNGVGESGCESVDRGSGPIPPPDPKPDPKPDPNVVTDSTVPSLASVRATPGRRGRLTLRFRLSEPATVTMRLQRRSGRRWRTLRGSARHAGKAGANTMRFGGRLAGRRVRAGRYRVVLTARDGAGNTAPARRLIVKLRR